MEGKPSFKKMILSATTIASFFVAPTQLQAMDTFMVGPRAMGMGGANVASPVDTNAQYYNPAQFGFLKHRDKAGNRTANDNQNLGKRKWGLDVNASTGYRLHNNLGQYIDDLSKIDFDLISKNGLQTKSDLENLVKLVNRLDNLDDPGNGITVDAVAHASTRIGHLGVGANVFFQATGRVLSVDNTNLGINFNAGNLETDIDNVRTTNDPSFNYLTYNPVVFNSSQVAQLVGTGLITQENVEYLDYLAAQQGITSADIQGTVDLLDTVITSSGSSGLESNNTTVLLTGLGVLEVPVSYGYALNDNLSFGVNVKFMKGRVYGNQVLVFDQNSGDTIDKTDEFYEETNAIGVDVGVLARFRKVNLGLVGRNLNSPKFDGPTVNLPAVGLVKFEDVTLDPQLTAGVALVLKDNLIIEADLDLTENETTLADYKTRNFGVGVEWDIWKILALRAGTYKNLAESDIDLVYTAGLGLNMYATRVDIAATYSDQKEQFDEDEYPKEFKVALEISVDF